MPHSSYERNNFLGGERSALAQGRSDRPDYAISLDRCLNHIPAEEGALVRRPGTLRISPTYNRVKAKFLKFISSGGCPFMLEATPLALRIIDGASFVFDATGARTVSTSSFAAGAVTLGLDAAHGWSIGDQVMLDFAANGVASSAEATCRGRVFTLIGGSSGSTVVLEDDLSNQLSLTGFVTNTSLVNAKLYRIKRFTTVYTATDIPNLRAVQSTLNATLLVPTQPPYALSVQDPPNSEAIFTFGALTLVDGPYLDLQAQTLTLSAVSGAITLTAGSAAFVSTDVGRAVRIFTQPALWASGTTYAVGNNVTDAAGRWWTSLIAGNLGVVPGQTTVVGGTPQQAWAPNPTAGNWAWGLITAVGSATSASFTFDTTITGMALQSANGLTASAWRMGVYSGTTGYSGAGSYFEGRLWLFGTNRFDASFANGMNAGTATVAYSPTDPYGNVTDDNGVSEALNSKTVQAINWGEPDAQGLLVGTLSGEWLISASVLGDPITPTNIQAHQVTSVRSLNIEPIRTPLTLVFPQTYGRRVVEYLADAFSQRFTSKPLNEWSRHMTVSGVARVDYQDEPIPAVWVVTNDGKLLSCTYRRVSRFATEEATFAGWAPHKHGGGTIVDVCVVPATTGSSDRVYVQSRDAFGYHIELLTPSVEVSPIVSVRDGWFVDASPGATLNRPAKCGFLNPSIGVRPIAVYTPPDFGEPLPPQPFLPAPGTVIPPAPSTINFTALNNGVYFNGYSALFNLLYKATLTNFSLSVWLYLVSNSGALWNTPIPGGGVGYEDAPGNLQGAINTHSGAFSNSAGNGSVQVLENGWYHYMFGMSGGTSGHIAINDTVYGTPVSFNSGAGIPGLGFSIGGSAQVTMIAPPSQMALSGLSQIPAAYGLVAGMAELWVDTTYIDWSVAANRQKFHCTDVANLRYAPVNLGTQGQTPTGANPQLYLSGSPSAFRINRAKKVKVATYNNGAFGFFANNIDPDSTVLDSLPPSIKPVS